MNDENKINYVLKKHHEFVRKSKLNPVMTVLVGSQNYNLATENSDYDTYTFVLPSVRDIAVLNKPVSMTLEDEHGHINIKDIRIAFNLLKKTSPNSVEYFATRYKYVEPEYPYLNTFPQIVFRCNTENMMKAIDDIVHNMPKRNMSKGKCLSHIVRMYCMMHNYMNINSDLLSLTGSEHDLAMRAKLDPDNPDWDDLITVWTNIIKNDLKEIDMHYFDDTVEHALKYIEGYQTNLVGGIICSRELLFL